MIPNKVTIYKNIGETPLEALERFRVEKIKTDADLAETWKTIPMTYAGRLDPMAEGELLILIGDECKNKDAYLGLDKEYEVEIVFGISTDTYDALGLATLVNETGANDLSINIPSYIGKFTQAYPAYSSKTFGGKQLHELARSNQLPEEMPKREVEIYELELLGSGEINSTELQTRIQTNIALVKGDFRQEEIKARWDVILHDETKKFKILKIKVTCSGGTYMSSLAERMGVDTKKGAFALSIKRTKIGTIEYH